MDVELSTTHAAGYMQGLTPAPIQGLVDFNRYLIHARMVEKGRRRRSLCRNT